jgi:hypothetical protein
VQGNHPVIPLLKAQPPAAAIFVIAAAGIMPKSFKPYMFLC